MPLTDEERKAIVGYRLEKSYDSWPRSWRTLQ